MTEFHSAKV